MDLWEWMIKVRAESSISSFALASVPDDPSQSGSYGKEKFMDLLKDHVFGPDSFPYNRPGTQIALFAAAAHSRLNDLERKRVISARSTMKHEIGKLAAMHEGRPFLYSSFRLAD